MSKKPGRRSFKRSKEPFRSKSGGKRFAKQLAKRGGNRR